MTGINPASPNIGIDYLPEADKMKTNIHDPNSIKFYDKYTPYYIFSNFYDKAPFIISGITYLTPEHYFQSEKFTDPIVRQRIIKAQTGLMAMQIANQNKNLAKQGFNDMGLMLNALRAKFSQNPSIATDLVKTIPNQLIFHTMNDNYWGDGGNGSGWNHLGQLLVKVRDELKTGTLSTTKPFMG